MNKERLKNGLEKMGIAADETAFDRFEAFIADITKNIQLCVAQNRMIQADHFAMTFAGGQNIHADCPDVFS